jgi:hypothetical protein
MRAGSFAQFGPLLAAEMMMIDEIDISGALLFATEMRNARPDRLFVGRQVGAFLLKLLSVLRFISHHIIVIL